MAGISLSKHTVTSIGNLITSDGQPTQRKNAYIMDIKNRIKHQNEVAKNIFIGECLKKNCCTAEITALAKRTIGDQNQNKRQFNEEIRVFRVK